VHNVSELTPYYPVSNFHTIKVFSNMLYASETIYFIDFFASFFLRIKLENLITHFIGLFLRTE
jgi:hypothetical protein